MKTFKTLVPMAILFVMMLVMAPAQAQSPASWKIDYFNNPYLIAPATSTQYVNNLAMNWGAGAPASNMPADTFSARMSADVYFPAGTYRFYLLSDDRAHLYVDFKSIINNWDNPTIGQILTRDITLPGGTLHVQVDYREEQGNAYAFLDWESTADGIQGPRFSIPSQVISGGPWTAEYYANLTLSGAAFTIRGESTPNNNWGIGAPVSGMAADNFSVRWTTSQAFDGSAYQISVRADDGVRVYLDNALIINQWNLATGQTYTATIQPSVGNHQIRIEYYEAGGLAFLEYSLNRTSVNQPGNVTGAFATVTAGRLNVRNLPTASGSTVLTKIDNGQTFPIVGVNAARTWWQINVNGTVGWVSGFYVTTVNTQNVPVTDGTAPVNLPATGYRVTTIANLNMRSGPSAATARVGLIPIFNTADVIGRNASATWWYVRYAGITGWVSASFAPIQSGANIQTIPILG